MFNSKVKTNHVLKIFMNEKIIAKVVSTGGSSRRTMHDFFLQLPQNGQTFFSIKYWQSTVSQQISFSAEREADLCETAQKI